MMYGVLAPLRRVEIPLLNSLTYQRMPDDTNVWYRRIGRNGNAIVMTIPWRLAAELGMKYGVIVEIKEFDVGFGTRVAALQKIAVRSPHGAHVWRRKISRCGRSAIITIPIRLATGQGFKPGIIAEIRKKRNGWFSTRVAPSQEIREESLEESQEEETQESRQSSRPETTPA